MKSIKEVFEKEPFEECEYDGDCDNCHFHCCPYEELNNP
jgi:hypothetical protein